MSPKVLCIDGMNAFHRARSGFTSGDHAVVYNFFRQFRALVEMHSPTRVYVVMEGTPVKKRALLGEYKANRIVEPGTKKADEMHRFFKQVNDARALLEEAFPVSVVRHPTFEADDTVYNLIKRSSIAVPWVVASNDSDFTQLLNEFEHVRIYNPMQKTYVEKTPYDYAVWKALRGDGSDNIPRVANFTDKKAQKLVNECCDAAGVIEWMSCESDVDDEDIDHFVRNHDLIKFQAWTDEEAAQMTSSEPTRDWEKVRQEFDGMGFKSITNDKPWAKFVGTFDKLWGT